MRRSMADGSPDHASRDLVGDAVDFLQDYRFYTSGPLQRLLINRWRKRVGRAPFPWFERA